MGQQTPGAVTAELAAGTRQVKIREHGATNGLEPETTCVVGADHEASHALAKSLHGAQGWCVVAPADGERVLF